MKSYTLERMSEKDSRIFEYCYSPDTDQHSLVLNYPWVTASGSDRIQGTVKECKEELKRIR